MLIGDFQGKKIDKNIYLRSALKTTPSPELSFSFLLFLAVLSNLWKSLFTEYRSLCQIYNSHIGYDYNGVVYLSCLKYYLG